MRAMEGGGMSPTFGAGVAEELVGAFYTGTEEEQQFGVGGREKISFSFC